MIRQQTTVTEVGRLSIVSLSSAWRPARQLRAARLLEATTLSRLLDALVMRVRETLPTPSSCCGIGRALLQDGREHPQVLYVAAKGGDAKKDETDEDSPSRQCSAAGSRQQDDPHYRD